MALLAAPSLAMADALKLEPGWIRTRKIRFGNSKLTRRFVHFTDLHHRGDRAYMQGVAEKINSLSPDFVCFTGDIVEETKFLPEAPTARDGAARRAIKKNFRRLSRVNFIFFHWCNSLKLTLRNCFATLPKSIFQKLDCSCLRGRP